jgi:hypothetical protein
MEIHASENEWIHTDSENWAAFLETGTGKRLIPEVVRAFPELLASGDVNAILIRSGEVRAYQRIVDLLLTLAHPPVVPSFAAPNEYPRLEDDAAWNDGQKISGDSPGNQSNKTPNSP